ncbi:hypothetical protein [Desulfosarcina sp.]|uniref:hypothetical protein n=1 Tax=Desulfosarcina sp. TaxID=2027861 RepID=UPI003565FFE8
MYAAHAITNKKMNLIDKGGRRFGDDRRLYSYNGYLPERRSDEDRRSGMDRRSKPRAA